MINGRLFPYLVMFVVSILPISMFGQSIDSRDKDFVELLEMQLLDIKQENERLAAELKEASQQNQSKSGYKKDIENLRKENASLKKEIAKLDKSKEIESLNKENALLKSEIIKLDKSIEVVTNGKSETLSELNKLRKELKSKESKVDKDLEEKNEELTALCTNLEDENAILKQEVDNQKKHLSSTVSERDQLKSDYDQLSKMKPEGRTKDGDKSGEIARLQQELASAKSKLQDVERNSIDKARAAEISSKMEEMKAVEIQRKEALDDLFKQLAEVKGELKAKDLEITSLGAKVSESSGLVTAKDVQIGDLEKSIKDLQAVVDSHGEIKRELNDSLEKERELVASKEALARREVASRQSVEEELSRLKLTDTQRKKTMDDVLTSLATAENLNISNAAKIKELESNLGQLTAESKSEIENLKDRNKLLDEEIASMEQEVKAVVDSRDHLKSKVAEGSSVAERDTARIVELEANLARVNATDTQRKKRMDKLLLEIAELEDTHAGNQDEVESSRQEVGKLRADLASLKNNLTDAQNKLTGALAEIKDLKAGAPKGGKGDTSALRGELTSLQSQNDQLKQKVAALEKDLGEAGEAKGKDGDSGKNLDELVALEKAQWMQLKSDLESEIGYLQKSGKDQSETVNKLKSDLAESEQIKEQLSKEVRKLENRKIDVRSSDLFQEMESANVTLREKIVQVESERQRLAKSEKKLLKRDDSFDDEISHEKNLRQKAETELSDARARELEYQELIERLMAQVPQLEAQISELSKKMMDTSNRLSDREEDLMAMKSELEKREHRLIKAERVAEVLESAREDVLHASDKEKLDMHYNMAAVYAREGKYGAAEQEYLHALRLNPTDADVHYNLGILYDDELKSSTKAIVHYRRYLKLKPHGPDADQVRNWLMKLEMQSKH